MAKKLSKAERERRAAERQRAKDLEARSEAVVEQVDAAVEAAEDRREAAAEVHEAELERSAKVERDFRKAMDKAGADSASVEKERLKKGEPVNVGIDEAPPPPIVADLPRPAETLRLRDALEGARLSEADKATDLARTVEPVRLEGEVPEGYWRRELVLDPRLSEQDKVYLAEREQFYRDAEDAKAGFVPHDSRGGRTIAPRIPARAAPPEE